jgi:hypothetical protein
MIKTSMNWASILTVWIAMIGMLCYSLERWADPISSENSLSLSVAIAACFVVWFTAVTYEGLMFVIEGLRQKNIE